MNRVGPQAIEPAGLMICGKTLGVLGSGVPVRDRRLVGRRRGRGHGPVAGSDGVTDALVMSQAPTTSSRTARAAATAAGRRTGVMPER